jgi:deazaflavin-dependent oxidoreductase (nitroreductase family)
VDIKEINRKTIEQFRGGGPIEGMHRERLVLLTTTGAKTGQPHTTPMMFVPDEDRVLVIASNMGAPKDPDWYVNLCVNPRVTVEIGDESYEADAWPLTGDEYDRLWSEIKESNPFFVDHEAKAARIIPVVAVARS